MTITKIIVLGSLAALYLILAQAGVMVMSVTGLPAGTGGIINILWSATIPVIAVLITRQFGAATFMLLVYYTLALPFPIGGPPGFLPKIIIGLIGGLTMDVAFQLLKKHEKIASATMAFVENLFLGLGVIVLLGAFGLPGADVAKNVFTNPKILAPFLAIPAALGLFAWWIYKKLENTAVVRRIRGDR